MKYRRKLFFTKNPYDLDSTEEIFFRAMKENCSFQYKKCTDYRKISDGLGFSPDDLKVADDLKKMPFLPTAIFKRHRLFAIPPERVAVKATSSGTKGVFSKIAFELSGLILGFIMVIRVAKKRKLFSLKPANYLLLGYKPHRKNKTAVTKTAFGATLFAPAFRRSYALKYSDGKYNADLEEIVNAAVRYSKSRFPVRFMGFPSYTYFVLKIMEERGIFLKLKKGSKIMLGGGWKQHYAERVDKGELYRIAKKVLDIEEENIIEFFGAVEHPVLYCDCPHHRFHIPAYARVIIRDVSTAEPVENGILGLVNLLTPMVKATPILSVMTDDLGVLHDSDNCPCGIKSPYLEIAGRVGLKDIKTCAAGAADYLSGVKL